MSFCSGPWSAFRSWLPGLYGYGLLKATNATHLYWEQKLEFLGMREDAIWIVQHNHGPFPNSQMRDNYSDVCMLKASF